MGPLNRGGAPIFLGRWYDSRTNRIKTLMKPRYLYNPTDWNSTFTHSIFTLINKWNSFARAEQNVLSLMRTRNSAAWRRKVKSISRKSRLGSFRKQALKNLLKQFIANQGSFKYLSANQKTDLSIAFRQWDWNFIM